MALIKGRRGDIPSDAVVLSERDAIKYQLDIINTWKNKSDTFAFRYGSAILGSMSAITGMYINNHYRLKFRLLKYGHFSSYLPTCVIPSLLSMMLHSEFVLCDVVLQKSCVVCTELKSSAIQAISGCVFPAFLAPLATIPLAMQYNTYDIPYITREPKKVLQLWQKHTKPIGNILFGIFLFQALVASAITYFESKSVIKISTELTKLERSLEDYGQLP